MRLSDDPGGQRGVIGHHAVVLAGGFALCQEFGGRVQVFYFGGKQDRGEKGIDAMNNRCNIFSSDIGARRTFAETDNAVVATYTDDDGFSMSSSFLKGVEGDRKSPVVMITLNSIDAHWATFITVWHR